jgi:thiosulfate/3-mercaptopyruvate sulfurtransferase
VSPGAPKGVTLLPSLVPPGELAVRLGDPRIVVLDATTFLDRQRGGGPYRVRSGLESYLQTHLPGAGFVDIGRDLSRPATPRPFTLPTPELLADRLGNAGVGDDVHVVAYAQAEPIWATRLWWLLRYVGHDAASVLDGGLAGWRAAGLPVEAGPVRLSPRRLTVRPRHELVVSLPEMARLSAEAAAGHPRAWLVNALRPSVFRGEGLTSYSRPGRIPGSVNLPWTSLVDAGACWRDGDARRRAIAAASVPDGERVVAYCGGGISATAAVFAWFLEGRADVALYDGSLAEWTAHEDLPVEVG